MVRDRLVFFTTDAGFLLPTLVAARQVRDQPRIAAVADVMIFLVGVAPALAAEVRAAFEPTGLRFAAVDPAAYALPPGATFAAGHVPTSTLARLAIAEQIPPHYEHLVYLDGDTQVVGDLLPLVAHDVAPGKVLAATDHNIASSDPHGPYGAGLRAYVRALGVRDDEHYFNAGVLACRRATWAEIGPAALAFMRANSALCRFHDQSALNAVCDGRRELLHPSFNYAPAYRRMGQRGFGPTVIHFIGSSKPWQDGCTLWDGRWHAPYAALVGAHPFLAPSWRREGGAEPAPAGGLKARLQRWRNRRRLAASVRRTAYAVRPAGARRDLA